MFAAPVVQPFPSPYGIQPVLGQSRSQEPAPAPTPGPPEVDFDRSINYYADYSGCGHWRMIWPEHILNAHQKAVIHGTTMMVLDERYYDNTHSVRVQRQATGHQLEFIKALKGISDKKGFRLIYEIDDIVFHEDIPEYNKFKPAFVDPEIRQSALEIMNICDEITVTCKFMQEYYRSKTSNQNITVIPNYPPKWWIGKFYDPNSALRNYRKNRKKPRIVYAASGAHFDVENKVGQRDDFFHVTDVIAKTVDQFQWVFLGAFPLPLAHLVRDGKIEFHDWRRLYEYPQLLHDVDPTVLIAPLQDNTFNRAKSDLKYIEACCMGIPIICQDLCTYENAPYRFSTGAELIDQIRSVTRSQNQYCKAAEAARAVADTRWLELDENSDKYAELYRHPYKSPERKLLNSLDDNK